MIYIVRSGTKGMKWYHRFHQSYETKPTRSGRIGEEHFKKGNPTTRNGKAPINNIIIKEILMQHGVKSKNYEKWGTDPDHNVLYIGGLSGSGKSTAAYKLSKSSNAKLIECDAIFYKEKDKVKTKNGGYKYIFSGTVKELDKDFKKLLDKNVKGWKKVQDREFRKSKNKEYEKLLDSISDQFEVFGREQWYKGNNVIAEGIQFVDGTFYFKKDTDRSQIPKDKPQIYFNNPLTSMYRQFKRGDFDDASFFEILKWEFKDNIKWVQSMNQKMKDIDKEVQLYNFNKMLKRYIEYNPRG